MLGASKSAKGWVRRIKSALCFVIKVDEMPEFPVGIENVSCFKVGERPEFPSGIARSENASWV